MERHFDEHLRALKLQLMKMGAMVETMMANAVEALVDRRAESVSHVHMIETHVNVLQIEIDRACMELIALHQPAACDLRFILGAAKINAELERLADQTVNIVNKAERLLALPPLRPFSIIPEMAAIAREMVRDSLHAFVNRDVDKARAVLLRDDELDERKVRINAELSEFMTRDVSSVERALALILIAHNLERIGDHATNIGENTIFVVQGHDVRHYSGPPTS